MKKFEMSSFVSLAFVISGSLEMCILMFKEDMLFKTHPDPDPDLQKVNPRILEKTDPIQNSLYELKNYFCQI